MGIPAYQHHHAEQARRLSVAMTSSSTKAMVSTGSRVPYFLSAALAGPHPSDYIGYVTLSWIGLVLHVSTWITIVGIDLYLMTQKFNARDATDMLTLLQTASLITVLIPACLVILFTILHYAVAQLDFNHCLLPPFVSSAILSCIRATLELSKFLLFFSIFEPIAEVQGANAVDLESKRLLITLIVFKYFGTSLTMNNYRQKLFLDKRDQGESGCSVSVMMK
jgi:hypothetical protein